MLDVVSFKWKANEGYHTQFTAEHVNTLYRMVRNHYSAPFRFTIITDEPSGIHSDIRIIPLWDDHATIASPFGDRHPACYRRLKLFSQEARDLIGERIVCLDLDVVITGDLMPLWNRPEDVVFFKGQWGAVGRPNGRQHYNGSMFLLRAGSRPQVWEKFHPRLTPKETRNAGLGGSDQAWYAMILGANEATWGKKDGVYSFRNDIATNRNLLPSDARIVLFHGRRDPWDAECRTINWVQRYYGPFSYSDVS
jgi:hypothetical protein